MSFTRQSSPYETTSQDRLMGAALVLTIIIAVYSLSKGSFLGSLTDERIPAYTFFSQSYGILPGAEISLSGILIGHVESVALERKNQVKISVLLKPEYRDFYRQGSILKVNSGLGLDTMISGKGLEFIPGDDDNSPLTAGTQLTSQEPQSIEDMLNQWNVKQLAQDAEKIVANLAQVSDTLVSNQQYLVAMIHNLAATTEATNNMLQTLPPVIDNVNVLILQLNKTVASLDTQSTSLSSDLTELTTSSTELTQNINSLVLELQPSIKMLPSTLSTINRTSLSTNQFIETLNSHWLFGKTTDKETNLETLRYIGDDSIYTEGLGIKPKNGN